MTPLFPSRRSAAEFASALDGTAETEVAERYSELLTTVGMLRVQERPDPRPEFVADLRSQLMLAADAVLVKTERADHADAEVTRMLTLPERRTAHRRERRLGAAAATLVLVGATAGMAAAAQGALPGDPLYPIKRSIESAELHLNTNDAGKGSDLLGQAGTRLAEVDSMVAERQDPTRISSTLTDFATSAGRGADLLFVAYQRDGHSQDIARVREFAASQMAALQDLAPESDDGAAAEAFTKAARTLADIDQQARVLCADCGEGGPLTMPAELITLSSAETLSTLLSEPAEQAQAQVESARLALQRLRQSGRGKQGATGQAPEGAQAPPPVASSVAGTAGVPSGQPGGVVDDAGLPLPKVRATVKKATTPVDQLLHGVTGTSGEGLGGTVSRTLDGIASLLG